MVDFLMFSFLPVVFSFLVCFFILGVFLWNGFLFVFFLLGGLVLLPFLIKEVSMSRYRRKGAFILFLVSEALAFASLLVTTLWFEDDNVHALSDWNCLPAAGCVLLIHSSIAVSIYHKSFLPGHAYNIHLLSGLFLGWFFIYMQVLEMWECRCDITFSSYYSASFCTVGLHFLHVLIGLLVLEYVYLKGTSLSFYYSTLSIWYWHFVDYIWILVYLVVYFV